MRRMLVLSLVDGGTIRLGEIQFNPRSEAGQATLTDTAGQINARAHAHRRSTS